MLRKVYIWIILSFVKILNFCKIAEKSGGEGVGKKQMMGRKLRILQISKPVLPISRNMKYGGIERVVRDLDEAYLKEGHESFVVAPTNSEIKGILIPTNASGSWVGDGRGIYSESQKEKALKYHAEIALKSIEKIKPDIIHDHLPIIMQQDYLKNTPKVITLTTLHGALQSENGMSSIPNPTPQTICPFNHFNSISESQRHFFSNVLPVEFNVYNAINVADYPFESEKRDYLLSIGKIGINKGQDIAIRCARNLGKKLIIAGPVHGFRGPIKDFWENCVKPNIDEFELDMSPSEIDDFTKYFSEKDFGSKGRIAYVGEIDHSQKKELFKRASGFLMPIRWHEPFGLVMIESMATGTPVIAYKMGAVPEIVVHNRTGYVIKSNHEQEFQKAIGKLNKISPEDCRRHVEYNFDTLFQARKYIDIFNYLINNN